MLIKPTRDDLRRFSTLAKACYKAGRNDAGYDFEIASLRCIFEVSEYEELTHTYQQWRETGTLPN